jgi:hypothetical protein
MKRLATFMWRGAIIDFNEAMLDAAGSGAPEPPNASDFFTPFVIIAHIRRYSYAGVVRLSPPLHLDEMG